MHKNPEFFADARVIFCERYVGICDMYSYTRGLSESRPTSKQLLKSSVGIVNIKKCPPPGNAYDVIDVPEGCSLRFVIKSTGSIDANFRIGKYASTMHSLYCYSMKDFNTSFADYFPTPLPHNLRSYWKSSYPSGIYSLTLRRLLVKNSCFNVIRIWFKLNSVMASAWIRRHKRRCNATCGEYYESRYG